MLVVASVVIRRSRGFRCAARLRLAAAWSVSCRDCIGQEKGALPSRAEGTREKRRKRRRRFPSIAARVDTVGCVRLFVRSSSEAMPPSPPCRGCRAKRPFMYPYHRALGLRPCEKKIRVACGKAAWTQKKGNPALHGRGSYEEEKGVPNGGTETSFVFCQECPRTGLPVIRWVRQHATRRSKAKP